MAEMQLRDALDRRWTALKSERQEWFDHWRELSRFILPRRGRFLWTDTNRGQKINTDIVDPTGIIAARTLASGMLSGICSPSRPWFRLYTADPGYMEFGATRLWLESVERRLYDVLARSNFYNAVHVYFEELGIFGTAAMCELEDDEDLVRFYPYTAGEYAIANSPRLKVDTLYTEFVWTADQIYREFKDKASKAVVEARNRGNTEAKFPLIHAIEPNDDRIDDPFSGQDKAYRSVYWEAAGDRLKNEGVLSKGGFDEFPAFVSRWHVTGTDTYGRSPGMDALPDVKMLQLMQKRKAQAVEKMANPPMVAPSTMRNEPISTLPGSVIFGDAMTSNGTSAFRPAYEVNPRVAELSIDIDSIQRRIHTAFFADLFLMISSMDKSGARDRVTAREIQERHEEKLLALGPVLERLNDELLDPVIDRTFNIMVRASRPMWSMGLDGIIPRPPPELAGVPLNVEYISMLAQAQKAVGVGAIERTGAYVIGLAQMYPDVIDKFDPDEAVDQYAMFVGTPAKVIRSDDQVAQIRAAKAEQQRRLMMQDQLMQAAEGAKTLSQAETGPNRNALMDLRDMTAAAAAARQQ